MSRARLFFSRFFQVKVRQSSRPRQPSKAIRRRRLHLESLEDRVLFSIQAISVADPSLPAISSGAQMVTGVSNDGRFVLFESPGGNLVPGDNNGVNDVFVRNIQSGTTALVDVTPTGTSCNAGAADSVMTPDGRYVAFDTGATDLTSDATNSHGNVFVRDLQTGTTRLVSVNSGGTGGGNADSSLPQITPDGRYVVFLSQSTNLVPISMSQGYNLFVRDLVANTTTLVTINTAGTDGSNGRPLLNPAALITPNGRYVIFSSDATNLINGFGDGLRQNVFARDLVAGLTIPVSIANSGSGSGNGDSDITSISDDGRFVLFESASTNLVPGKTNNQFDVFERDLVAKTTSLVSVNLSGVTGDADSFHSSMSSNGRFVAFQSYANDLVRNDTNNNNDIFVRDMLGGTTFLVSQNSTSTGSANGYSDRPVISSTGSFVAFLSYATDLVSGVTLNGVEQVFVRSWASGLTWLVSINQSGTGGGNNTSQGSVLVSPNGSFVAFPSQATNLVSGILSNVGDVFLRNVSAATTTLVSARDPSLPSVTPNGPSFIDIPIPHRRNVSSDGRYVVFTSSASNLLPGDNNGASDVFVRDTWNATTTLVSVNQSGTGSGNGPSYDPSISADGHCIVFTSTATDLVSGANNAAIEQIFVRDLITGTTTLVSVNGGGTGGNDASNDAFISANGRYVVFDSAASDLVANDNNNTVDVFERDLLNQTTALVSVNINGTSADSSSSSAVVSPDGRYISFLSYANDLISGDTTSQQEVFLRDMVTGTTLIISVDNSGVPGNGSSQQQVITPDGRYVAFVSFASNLAPGKNVFVRDVQAGTTKLVSVNKTNTGPGNGASQDPVISDDGRYVAFDSSAFDLVNNDNNSAPDVFLRDLVNGTTTLVSINASGTGSGIGIGYPLGGSQFPAISANGRFVSFMSYANDLVQTPTFLSNIYVRDLSSGITALLTPDNDSYAADSGRLNGSMMTPDAQHVVFSSDGNLMVRGDFNQSTDVFLWSNSAASLLVAGYASPTTPGVGGSFTITARDAGGNVAPNYSGTIHFTSSDLQAVLPADYTFTSADAGQHTFNATLKTAGTQSLTATDTVTSTITGSQMGITVSPAATASFVVAGYPTPVTSATSNNFTVTAKDPYGNTTPNYTGTVHFTSSDAKAVLPANYTFTSGDAGVHIFSVTLRTAGSQSITATDAVTSSITGSQTGITVNPGATHHLVISFFPSRTTAGVAQNFLVTAQDLYGNRETGFTGAVAFMSSDGQAVLPVSYTFTSTDAGVHIFSATLKTAGSQSVTVKDTTTTSVFSGTRSGITVTPAAASQLQISGFPASVTAGTAYGLTVTALDPFGNIATSYRGTVAFTSSDNASALPANYPFTSADAGAHAFTATLNTAGTQSITATDTVNAGITGTESGINVVAVQPTAGISGPSAGVPGQPLPYTLTASESGLDASTVYFYSVQWGDGAPVQTLSGPSGTQVVHAFPTPGTSAISLTATDPNSHASVPATTSVTLTTTLMETDPYDGTLTALYVGGTTGNDTIAITPVSGGGVKVGMNFVNYGSFFPTGHVVVYGQSGNDIIKTAAQSIGGMLTYVNVPLLIFAGNGNDILNVTGSNVGNVLVGGSGSDRLLGGQGRDILIGGSGPSTLQAGSGGDILIGGTTSFDNNAAALAAVLAEWSRTDVDYATRIAHLMGTLTGGLNHNSDSTTFYYLNPSTVQNDGMVNNLFGGPGQDWFFAG